jgi:hypothetical protein
MADKKQGGSKSRQRSSRNSQKGIDSRRRAGLPAKAGRRKTPPAPRGKHLTTPQMRKRAAMLSRLGLGYYKRPAKWIDFDAGETC